METVIARGALEAIWHAAGAPTSTPLVPSDRQAWADVDPEVRAEVLATARTFAGTPWPQPLLSQWSAFGRTGDRRAYELLVLARNRRVRYAVLAAAIDPTPARLSEAADGLWLLCEQSSWCWPAHDESFQRGLLTTEMENPILDLGAGELAALLAWSKLILGDALDAAVPGLVKRMGDETRRRVLEPFLNRRDWHWFGIDGQISNWSPWIHHNLMSTAMAFADGDVRDRVLAFCVEGIDSYLAQLPADGAIDEGFAYWWQGAARAFDALGELNTLTEGAIADAIANGPLHRLREVARFPERVAFSAGWVASYADAQATVGSVPWHSLYQAATLCDLPDTAAYAVGCRDVGALGSAELNEVAGLGRMLPEIFDRSWRAAAPGAGSFPERVEYPSIGFGLRREVAGDTRGLTVVVKGGHNAENHNQNDLGSLAVAVDGVPLLADFGTGVYSRETFSDRRYELWFTSSEWHSTIRPLGLEQLPGKQWKAPLEMIDDGWTLDLSEAYPWPDGADSGWTRTVRLADGELIVRDEGAAVGDADTRIIYACVGVPEQTADGILIPGRFGTRDLLLVPGAGSVEIETRDTDDAHLERSWGTRVSRILFTPPAGTQSWTLTGRARG